MARKCKQVVLCQSLRRPLLVLQAHSLARPRDGLCPAAWCSGCGGSRLGLSRAWKQLRARVGPLERAAPHSPLCLRCKGQSWEVGCGGVRGAVWM